MEIWIIFITISNMGRIKCQYQQWKHHASDNEVYMLYACMCSNRIRSLFTELEVRGPFVQNLCIERDSYMDAI